MVGTVRFAEDALLTTGQAARILGTSRQHVVDLCESGRLPFQLTGAHRRVRRRDLEAIQSGHHGLTRDQLRSLWLHRAVAGKLVLNPQRYIAHARRVLARMRTVHTRGAVQAQFDTWAALLDGPVDALLDMLVSKSAAAVELRQNSPFAGVLSKGERSKVLAAFRDSWQAA